MQESTLPNDWWRLEPSTHANQEIDFGIQDCLDNLAMDEFNHHSHTIPGDWQNDLLLPIVVHSPDILQAFRVHENYQQLIELGISPNDCELTLLNALNHMAQRVNKLWDNSADFKDQAQLTAELNLWLRPSEYELRSILIALQHNLLFDMNALLSTCLREHSLTNVLHFIYQRYIKLTQL